MPSCSAAAKFYSKDSINITVFGASTAHGMFGYDFEKPLQSDFEHCYTGKIVNITNNGIPGETTTQGLARFPGAIAGRTGFMLILMGANDAIALTNKKLKLSVVDKNMRYYIKTSLEHNLIPIIGTIQFFNDTKSDFNKTCNLYVKQINALYKKIAKDNNLYVADINKALGRDWSLYKDDIHPNEQGFNLLGFVWFDTVNQAIEDKLLLIGLNQNYPNPVRDNTKIGFSLSQAGRVQIKLYNMNGAIVKDIYDDYQSSGYHELTTSAGDLVPGIYIYVMQVGGQQMSKKMIVIR
ncbi:GDSL-type esterase/lipase family protein [Mucilaginibacter polytrichastri]|uniref:SGNH hydrolase-type esterase domain-containing protein n=1 Tax=Mucilaginibacter polytrichastri TaxID=1302689 RepID=A0A1Q5ZUU8_9SPHI|nr:GDSL-type esterase/lipase family protein [Mucilaginibacter polytrichastri]OKS85537.1 hypothetical protein RG47T_0983 [Mucilaginibacter polytrichastri]